MGGADALLLGIKVVGFQTYAPLVRLQGGRDSRCELVEPVAYQLGVSGLGTVLKTCGEDVLLYMVLSEEKQGLVGMDLWVINESWYPAAVAIIYLPGSHLCWLIIKQVKELRVAFNSIQYIVVLDAIGSHHFCAHLTLSVHNGLEHEVVASLPLEEPLLPCL